MVLCLQWWIMFPLLVWWWMELWETPIFTILCQCLELNLPPRIRLQRSFARKLLTPLMGNRKGARTL